ncbi:MAG: ABC transporter permease [Thermoplasmata archaeon]
MNKIFRMTYRILTSSLDISNISMLILMPVGYLLLMGLMMGSIIPFMYFNGEKINYVSFLAPGIVADQILLGGSMAGWILWADKRVGMVEQIFSMPYTRFDYLLGILISMLLVTFSGSLLMTIVAIPFIYLKITLLGFITVLVFLTLGTFVFGSLMLIFGAIVKSNQVFNLISNILFFFITFASSVFYPLNSSTPSILRIVAQFNPLTYVVNSIRDAYMNQLGQIEIYNSLILIAIMAVLMLISIYTYKKIKFSATV